LIREAIQIYQS